MNCLAAMDHVIHLTSTHRGDIADQETLAWTNKQTSLKLAWLNCFFMERDLNGNETTVEKSLDDYHTNKSLNRLSNRWQTEKPFLLELSRTFHHFITEIKSSFLSYTCKKL